METEKQEYLNVAGLQFRSADKVYHFAAGEELLKVGDAVVVDTERGPAIATVARLEYRLRSDFKDRPLKSILRRASGKDLQGKDNPGQGSSTRLTSEKAESFTKDKIKQLKLKMRVLKAEIQFGGSKVIIYFSAPGRVDFRELVKELAGGLKSRVELKQVGARDETKILGGVGICGREFCCSSFLREFVPVSIKMAKNQNLALNPTKVSGGCGRLLCCLTYENDLYRELRRQLPPRGTRVQDEEGRKGDVLKADFLNQTLLIEWDDGKQGSVKAHQLEILSKSKQADGASPDDTDQDEEEWGDDIDLGALKDLS